MKQKTIILVLLLNFAALLKIQAQDNCNTGASGPAFNTITTDPTNSNTGSQYPNNTSGPMGFNWWQPQTFSVYTQHGLTSPDAVLYSPFYCGGGSGYLDGACGNTNLEKYSDIHIDPNNLYNGSDYAKWKAMDILPEDGWELIKYNFGKAAAGAYNGAEAKMPFFIIYNRYTSKMKFFIAMTGLQGQVSNNQGATIKIYMLGQNGTSGDVRDVFAHASSITKTLRAFDHTQFFNVPNGLAAIGASPPSPFEYMWLYAEVPISYDPCTCDNLTSQIANTQIKFDVYTFQTTSVNETIDGNYTPVYSSGELNSGLHSVATSNPTTPGSYLTNVNSALNTFKDWSDYGEAIKKLNDDGTTGGATNNYYYTSLNQSFSAANNSSIVNNNSVSASTAQSLLGASSANGTAAAAVGSFSEVVPYVGIFLGLLDFVATMTQSNTSSSASTDVPTATAPTAYHVNEKITGTFTSESLQNGGAFYLPGSYANHNFNTAGQYNEDEPYPIYNNTLGVFNLVDIPTIQYKDIQVTNEGVPSGQPSNASTYSPDFSNNFHDYKLSGDLKYVINPAANLSVVSIDAAFVFEYQSSDYLYYAPTTTGNVQTLYYPGMSTSFSTFANSASGDGLSTIITNLKSSGIALEYQSVDYVSSVPSQNPAGSYIRFRTNYVPLQCLSNVDFIMCGSGPKPKTYIKLYCKFKRNDNGNIVTAVYTVDADAKYAAANSGTQTSGSIYSYLYCTNFCVAIEYLFFKDLYLYGAYWSPNYMDGPGTTYTSGTQGLSSTGDINIAQYVNIYNDNGGSNQASSTVGIKSMGNINYAGGIINYTTGHPTWVIDAEASLVASGDINIGGSEIFPNTKMYAGHNVLLDNGLYVPKFANQDVEVYAGNEIQIRSTTYLSEINGNATLSVNSGLPINGLLHGCSNPPDINNYKASSSDISAGCTAVTERLTAANNNNSTFSQPKKTTSIATKLGTDIKMGIFPNPTSGVVYLNLSAQSAGGLLVNISTLNGAQVMHNNFTASEGANSFKVDLSGLSQGVYFINITDENGVTIKNDKIILLGQ